MAQAILRYRTKTSQQAMEDGLARIRSMIRADPKHRLDTRPVLSTLVRWGQIVDELRDAEIEAELEAIADGEQA